MHAPIRTLDGERQLWQRSRAQPRGSWQGTITMHCWDPEVPTSTHAPLTKVQATCSHSHFVSSRDDRGQRQLRGPSRSQPHAGCPWLPWSILHIHLPSTGWYRSSNAVNHLGPAANIISIPCHRHTPGLPGSWLQAVTRGSPGPRCPPPHRCPGPPRRRFGALSLPGGKHSRRCRPLPLHGGTEIEHPGGTGLPALPCPRIPIAQLRWTGGPEPPVPHPTEGLRGSPNPGRPNPSGRRGDTAISAPSPHTLKTSEKKPAPIFSQ